MSEPRILSPFTLNRNNTPIGKDFRAVDRTVDLPNPKDLGTETTGSTEPLVPEKPQTDETTLAPQTPGSQTEKVEDKQESSSASPVQSVPSVTPPALPLVPTTESGPVVTKPIVASGKAEAPKK